MALTDILAKIRSEASAKEAEIKTEFEQKKKELEETNIKCLTQIEKESTEKVEKDSAKIKEKAKMEAEMESKNNLLDAKRQVIDDMLKKAVQKLASSENYEEILTKMLRKTGFESAQIIPAHGKEDSTKRAIEKAGKNYSLATESEGANIAGGFILKTEKVEIDNSFETIVNRQLRQSLEIDLNKLLFV